MSICERGSGLVRDSRASEGGDYSYLLLILTLILLEACHLCRHIAGMPRSLKSCDVQRVVCVDVGFSRVLG